MTTIDLASCLAAIPDRRRAEGKIYNQVGVILFSIIAMLSGARSYRQIHALIRARLSLLNAAFPDAALRRAPAYTSVRGILQQLDPNELEQAFRRDAERFDSSCAAAPSRIIAIDGKMLRQWSMTTLTEKLIKIGAKVVSHGRYVAFQMAEVAIPRNLFADILRMIAELRPPPLASTA